LGGGLVRGGGGGGGGVTATSPSMPVCTRMEVLSRNATVEWSLWTTKDMYHV